jgi:hypothetical protein
MNDPRKARVIDAALAMHKAQSDFREALQAGYPVGALVLVRIATDEFYGTVVDHDAREEVVCIRDDATGLRLSSDFRAVNLAEVVK